MAKKRSDPRDFIIVILVLIVLTQGFFLFFKKTPVKVITKELIREAPPKKPVFPVIPVIPQKPTLGRIVIIVDDCGYNLLPCQVAPTIKNPVTFSILPSLKFSSKVAECIHQNNKEVMLHLPMEAHNNLDKYPENYLIKTNMNRSKIDLIIAKALQSVPHASGVNNHMGSKATENKSVMTIVFTALKRYGLFFVDSVTGKSICRELAAKMGISFAERNVFLDNKNERTYIEGQFAQTAEEARKNGFAIAIGHARPLTLQIIKEQTELLEKEGYEFIKVQDLIRVR